MSFVGLGTWDLRRKRRRNEHVMISVGSVSIILEFDKCVAVIEERSSAERIVERSAIGAKDAGRKRKVTTESRRVRKNVAGARRERFGEI